MNLITTKILTQQQKEAIYQLWNDEYPSTLNYTTVNDFEKYLEKLTEPSHFMLLDQNHKIEGWYCDFIRDNEKWFAMIIASKKQGRGLGSQLLNLAKNKESKLNGWVVELNSYKKRDGSQYESPLLFYLKNGFTILPDHRSKFGELSVVKMKWIK